MLSFAQNFEDVLLWRALGNIQKGKYIDIGAHHPITDSVSRVFYEQGWRGIHIEPLPFYAEMLRNDRPGEQVIEAAVSAQPGILCFFDIEGSGLSTADPEIAEHHRAQGWEVREITVPTVTLDNIFGLIDDGIVHWLKIDVEGHERQVLEGWSAAVLPWVVVVESTYPCTQIDTYLAWEALLIVKGYVFAHHDGLNRYYISPEHPEIIPAFQYGANVFDGFQLADHHWAVTAQRQQLEAQRTQAQAREDEIRQQAAQQLKAQQVNATEQAEHLHARITEAQQRHAAHDAQQQIALAELRQQLEARRTQAQVREDEIRQQAAQQLQAQQAAAAQQAEHLQAQIATLQEDIYQQASYAQALVDRIVAMKSTWWWRFSMLWRNPSKWLPLPTPLLTQRQLMGAQSGALFSTDKSSTFGNTPSGELHKAHPPPVGDVGRGRQESDSPPSSNENNLTRSFPMQHPL